MPTYEYACDTCGLFDAFQSMSEDAYKKCPHCKGKKIHRVISGGAGVIFKGDGFWETDYNRSDDYKSKSKKDEKEAQGDKQDGGSDSADSSDSDKSKGDSTPSDKASDLQPQSKAQPKKVKKKPSKPQGDSSD